MRMRFWVCSIIVSAAAVSGAYASWVYASGPMNEEAFDGGVSITEFVYNPEEVLPDDNTSTQLGENHSDLIQNILFEASYGLNATKKPIIHNLLNQAGDVIYCQQNVQGGNLKHLMIDGTGAYSLLFQIEYVSDTEYITYTYLASDVNNSEVGAEIEVYKTVVAKAPGQHWEATLSYHGKAKVIRGSGGIRGIDASTFVITPKV